MPPKFIFLRHAEAEHNAAFRRDGPSVFENAAYRDPALTPLGIEQAIKVAKDLAELDILAIWSSPLTRCIQTSEEVFEEVNAAELILHDNIVERLGGNHVCNERKSKTLLRELHSIWKMEYLPELPAYWKERENSYAVHQLMFMFVMLLADIYRDYSEEKHVLIVSHNDAISTLIGRDMRNAEFVVLRLSDIIQH